MSRPPAPFGWACGRRGRPGIAPGGGRGAGSARPRRHSAALMAGAAALGCAPQAREGRRLPSLNCVRVPDGVDEGAVRKVLLAEHSIEIGGGLGPLAGKVWRIGLMGESARQENVLAVLAGRPPLTPVP